MGYLKNQKQGYLKKMGQEVFTFKIQTVLSCILKFKYWELFFSVFCWVSLH